MRFTSIAVTALLAGCVGTGFDNGGGGDDDGSGSGDTSGAKALYTSTVHSVMVQKCGQASCHGQPGITGVYGFGTTDKDSSYTQITALPTLVGTYTAASAGLITKVKQAGGHNAATYTADEEQKIGAWLAKEAEERGGSGMPPVDPVAKLAAWTGCMSLDNFEEANMPQAWNTLAAGSMRCANCHGTGLDTFLSGTGQAEPFFNALTTTKDFLTKYFTVDAMGNVIINTASFQNAATTLPMHPRWNAMMNIGMDALQEFYTLTLMRQTTGLPTPCDPPRLLP